METGRVGGLLLAKNRVPQHKPVQTCPTVERKPTMRVKWILDG